MSWTTCDIAEGAAPDEEAKFGAVDAAGDAKIDGCYCTAAAFAFDVADSYGGYDSGAEEYFP